LSGSLFIQIPRITQWHRWSLTLKSRDNSFGRLRVARVTLGCNTTLTSINFATNKFTAKAIRKLAYGLDGNWTLTHFDISGNKGGDRGVEEIVRALARTLNPHTKRFAPNTSLTSLALKNFGLGDAGVTRLAKHLEKFGLCKLRLDSNRIGEEGAESLGEALRKNPPLQTLGLVLTSITPKGATELALGISANTRLTELDVTSREINIQAMNALTPTKNHLIANSFLTANRRTLRDRCFEESAKQLTHNNLVPRPLFFR
jgi:Ran GTPase-activating protein (RanGAP) involved in mRNA processing and transport